MWSVNPPSPPQISPTNIALMNDAFNESAKEGGIGYWKLVSEVIAGKRGLVWIHCHGISCKEDDKRERKRERQLTVNPSVLLPRM